LLNHILGWLDERTGLVAAWKSFLDRPVPGGARWRHSLGFALAAMLLVELVTGVLLMLTYSPSTSTAGSTSAGSSGVCTDSARTPR